MEHVPIKKRRFFLRSPSPTPQSPKHCEESQKLDSSMCTLEQQTYVKGNTVQKVALIDFSESVCKERVMDGDVQNTASSCNGVPVANEDLTGTAILAVAACSGGLHCTVVDVDRTKMGDLPKSDDNETLDSTANVTENESNTTINDGTSQIMELSGSERNELVVSEISMVKTTECCELPGTANNVVLRAETIPFDSPTKDVEIAGKATETSDVPRNFRLHWDLNMTMDDWDHPADDTFAGSCMTSAEAAQTSIRSIQKSVDVETSTSRERQVAIESGDALGGQTVAYVMSESKTGSDMSISSLDVSSDHVTSHLKGINSLHGKDWYANERDNVFNDRGYVCHLEDGELRESVGHGWEHNEIEDAETEHVDYDSDDREGIYSVRLWGEVLDGDCEKQRFTLDKRVGEDCSQHQSCLSTHDQESPWLKSFSEAQLKQEEWKGFGRLNSVTDRPGKDFSDDALRDSRCGRRFSCSDRRSVDSIRNRSCNLGTEGRDKIIRVSEDTSYRDCRPRMVSTSRSGYNPMRKCSPGERNDFHDKRMVNGRDVNLDRNSRSKFDRFSSGINRGFREGYHRHGMLNNFGKGERSFSPLENGSDSHYPRGQRKYGSRSRSRSPEFRSEARMGREKSPHQPPGHYANHIREGRSSGKVFNQRPRFNTMSSPGRLRSNDGPTRFHDAGQDPDYEETDDHRRKPRFVHSDRRSRSRSRSFSPDFRSNTRAGPMRPPYQPTTDRGRGRRSFVRGFRQVQRYDNVESRGRFSDNPQSDRGNGADECRRKPQSIFDRIHPVRQYDADGDGRQFQYNERFNLNRNFRRNESYSRGGYKRAVDFRKEERRDVRYDTERIFYSGPKKFGDGIPSIKAYSSESEYLKITEEQLKASPAVQQDVTPCLQESQVARVSQSPALPTIASFSPENLLEPESSVRETATSTPSVGLIKTVFGKSFVDRFIVDGIKSHAESMTAVGLELTNFIDPSLTWKTVSKGRNTSRRSRKSILKTLELDQDKGKENLKRSCGEHSSESDKSDLSLQGRVFGNMEHVPIKKRRFLLRTPSPPPQSPKHCEESQELDSGKCTLEQQTFTDENTEQEVTGIVSSGSELKTCVMDGNVENTASSFDGVPVCSEDFSGIAMLAAAACGGGLDCIVGDIEKSNTASLLKSDDNESFASATITNENIAISKSTVIFEKAAEQLVEDDCMADSPSNNIHHVCSKNTIDDDTSQINELSGAAPNELVVSAINNEETIECCGLPDTVNSVALRAEDTSSDLPNEAIETAVKTTETSDVPRNYRLQWDLNTMMDDWDHPVDDNTCMQSTDVVPTNAVCFQNSVNVEASTQSTDIAPTRATYFQNPVNLEASTPGKGLLEVIANESGDRFNSLTLAYTMPESKAVTDSRGFTGIATASNLSGSSLDSHTLETSSTCIAVTKSCRDLAVAEAYSDIDKKGHNLVSYKGQSSFQTEMHKIDFSLVRLSANASSEVKAGEFGHTNYKEWNALDENDEDDITYQSVSPNVLGASSSKVAALGASPQGHTTFVGAKEIKPLESFSQLASSQSSCSEMPLVKLKDPDGAHCSGSMERLLSPVSMIIKNKSMNMVTATEIRDYSSTQDTSTCDQLMEFVPSVTETVKSVNHAKHLGSHAPEYYGVSDSQVFDKTSSELIINNENVVNARGCDSHLEDGELSYSVGHGWEGNEGEDAETEHVDYDFDDRDGICFEAANDSVQLYGDRFAGDCRKPRCGLDKSVPLQHQNSLSIVDANMAESSKRDSPLFRVCFGGQVKGKDRVEGDCKDCGRSNLETDRPEKDFVDDSLCNCRDSLTFNETKKYFMKILKHVSLKLEQEGILMFSICENDIYTVDKKRGSSNFGSMPQADRSGVTRQSSGQTDVTCGLLMNVELKSVETHPGPEEGEEKVVRDSEDTSLRVCRPRFISTSRSGYNPMRRSSPGERDNFHGTRDCRDSNLDINARSKFDRFTGGINRGFREGYHRQGMLNHFGKGERTFSPLENRPDSHYQQSQRKARSSSRTRSPDSRSEARMGRTRLPYQPPGHSANHIRERRSPVRVFNQRPRFNRLGSPGRFRSNDCPIRFHDTSRDPDYEESDNYRRKPLFMRNDRRHQTRCRSFSPDYRPNTRVISMRSPYQPTRGRRSPVRLFRHNNRYDNGESRGSFNDNSQSSRGNDYNDRGHIDSKERNALDENEKDISCKANDTNFGNLRPVEQTTIMDANENKSLKAPAQLVKSQSCSGNMEALVSPRTNIINKNAQDMGSTLDVLRCDDPMDILPNDTETLMSINLTGKTVKHLGCVTPESLGGCELHSELTKIDANARNARGYDCHLEDGELREPVGHDWENNEAQDIKTERDALIFKAATDSVELLGEVIAGDCEKPSCLLDKGDEENCYLQHQSCASTVDAKLTESVKRESSLTSVCVGAQLKVQDKVDGDCKDGERSHLENDRSERNFNDDALRDCGGASASGRGLQCSDVINSKLDSLHQADCSGIRHQSLVQTDLLCCPSRNVEVKNVAPDSGQEGGERVVRVSEDSSLRTWRPRIVTASRSGFNPMRRGSPEERENLYGSRMVNDRDANLDCNSRSKFDRFSGGINRGFRGGYNRPAMISHFGKGGRSLSPLENRLDSHYHRNHRKSRSRSRTRSPEFRSDARVGRTRLPYQPPGQSANHIKERRSPVRVFNQRPRFNTIGSPRRLRSNDCPMRFHDASRDPDCEEGDHYQRKPLFVRNDHRSRSRSRSFSPDCRPDARGGPIRAPYQPTAGPIRGRRSPPIRVFRQVQKYDNGESSGRFNDNSQSNRGNDYNNNGGDDFRRKPRNIFERIHPIRHHDEDGDGRRFQYNDQDNLNNRNFRRNENYGRGGGRRPMDFRREDRGNNVRYDSDRMFNSGPKQFGGMRGS
ncbi:hypothetical protein KSS87_010012 [Heliosperma pusillum]|nr:hypothetical protein KSS87_010012 [Heliosperma pusillum]